MPVFIDQTGKYYQTTEAKDIGDAMIEHPTPIMLEYLTEKPVTIPEFGVGVREGEVKKLQPAKKVLKKENKTPDAQVSDKDLTTL